MPQITYVEHDGARHTVASTVGISLMEAAVMHRVSGIEGDCGGFCACGTCHCYLDTADEARLPAMHDLERATLEFASDVTARCLLGCQIPVTDATLKADRYEKIVISMNMIVEGLVLGAFNNMYRLIQCGMLKQLTFKVSRRLLPR